MTGQPSSPGMCASRLRSGGVRMAAVEGATPCNDMAVAPIGRFYPQATSMSRTLRFSLRGFHLQVRRIHRRDRHPAGTGEGKRCSGLFVLHDLRHHRLARTLEYRAVLDHEFLRLTQAPDVTVDLG